MSYCRFSHDSDVYAYDCDRGIQIWVTKEGLDRLCRTYGEAYQYLLQLRHVHGLSVPDYAIDALKADAESHSPEFVALVDENARLRSCLSDDAENARQIMGENAELRKQIELLTTILRNDCDIDASWDGLRRFWSIELTESGCLMRDRACKAEAENAKLRRFVTISNHCIAGGCDLCQYRKNRESEDVECELDELKRELGI